MLPFGYSRVWLSVVFSSCFRKCAFCGHAAIRVFTCVVERSVFVVFPEVASSLTMLAARKCSFNSDWTNPNISEYASGIRPVQIDPHNTQGATKRFR
uniref:Uncharacterized protein n=1 Tax=Ixodes ricinus TaxID=34613 RepID=A0A6B0UHY9_IXORI